MENAVAEYIKHQNDLEADNCQSVDKAAEPTANVMARLLSFLSDDEGQKRALSRLGYCLGR